MPITDKLLRAKPDDELADRLPPGYADPMSLWFVEPEVRDLVADYPETERREIARAYDRGELPTPIRSYNDTATTADPDQDLDLAVHWVIVQRCKDRQRWAARSAEYAAAFANRSRCQCCGEVRSNTLDPNSVRRRLYPDGTTLDVCGPCSALIDQHKAAQLAAQTVNGNSRADLVADLLGAKR